jgi:hypothetical protein
VLALTFSGFDPGWVKTSPSRECAELFSPFSSFDGDRQGGSFVIERNRDKLSTRKFDVRVFTQPGPIADMGNPKDISLDRLGGQVFVNRKKPHYVFLYRSSRPDFTLEMFNEAAVLPPRTGRATASHMGRCF